MVSSEAVYVLVTRLQHFFSDLFFDLFVVNVRKTRDLFFSGLNKFVEPVATCADSFSNKSRSVLKVLSFGNCRHVYIGK